jgi:hypothetical protein
MPCPNPLSKMEARARKRQKQIAERLRQKSLDSRARRARREDDRRRKVIEQRRRRQQIREQLFRSGRRLGLRPMSSPAHVVDDSLLMVNISTPRGLVAVPACSVPAPQGASEEDIGVPSALLDHVLRVRMFVGECMWASVSFGRGMWSRVSLSRAGYVEPEGLGGMWSRVSLSRAVLVCLSQPCSFGLSQSCSFGLSGCLWCV